MGNLINPLALDSVPARGGRVEHHVHKVVVQQVHLVHVKKAAVRLCQEARLERSFLPFFLKKGTTDRAALLQGRFVWGIRWYNQPCWTRACSLLVAEVVLEAVVLVPCLCNQMHSDTEEEFVV